MLEINSISISQFRDYLTKKPNSKCVTWTIFGAGWSPLEPFLCQKFKRKLSVAYDYVYSEYFYDLLSLPLWMIKFNELFNDTMMARLINKNNEIEQINDNKRMILNARPVVQKRITKN